jgi:hypothetical protein
MHHEHDHEGSLILCEAAQVLGTADRTARDHFGRWRLGHVHYTEVHGKVGGLQLAPVAPPEG